jgi:cyclopropane fatty-acyl-phospholipid synthase-like methyltransferase
MLEKLCLLGDVAQPIQSMVEWGPGGGLNAVRFCATVPVFYGVDISPANLAECQRQVEARGLGGFRPVLIDIDKLEQCIELVEQPVDFFLSTAVYQHFPSKEYGIRVTELAARLLAAEGVALIQIRYDDGSPRLKAKKRNYEKNVIYFTSYNIDEFWQIAIDAGLEPLAVSLFPKAAYAYFFLKKGGSNG